MSEDAAILEHLYGYFASILFKYAIILLTGVVIGISVTILLIKDKCFAAFMALVELATFAVLATWGRLMVFSAYMQLEVTGIDDDSKVTVTAKAAGGNTLAPPNFMEMFVSGSFAAICLILGTIMMLAKVRIDLKRLELEMQSKSVIS